MIYVRDLSARMRYPMPMASDLTRRSFLLFGVALIAAGSGYAYADDDDHDDGRDHDRARRALEEGSVRPLSEILEAVGSRLDGEVVGVEFDREKGRYVYEFKVIGANGRLREIYVDASTAEILKVEDD